MFDIESLDDKKVQRQIAEESYRIWKIEQKELEKAELANLVKDHNFFKGHLSPQQYKAIKLKSEGYTENIIAARLGYSQPYAHKLVKEARQQILKILKEKLKVL